MASAKAGKRAGGWGERWAVARAAGKADGTAACWACLWEGEGTCGVREWGERVRGHGKTIKGG